LLLTAISEKAPLFRINESGDISGQFAIDVWTQVASARPKTNFWLYTRTFQHKWDKLLALPNVAVWVSTDEFNKTKADAFAKKYGLKQAYGPWNHKATLPTNSFICPATNGKLPVNAACQKCQICTIKTRTHKNVVFLAH
jgi:hypothetical protein